MQLACSETRHLLLLISLVCYNKPNMIINRIAQAVDPNAGIPLQDTLFGSQQISNSPELLNSPTAFFSALLPNIYIFSGIILLLYILYGGFLVVTAGSSADQAGQGQKAITNAIIGFGIIFASYWIIQAIQVLTGIPILTADGII